MDTTLHLLISGHVQGVTYRASMVRQAQAAGLRGWVRNLRDGRVEALVQGPQPALDVLLLWCRQGPPAAQVEEIQATPATAAALPPGFASRPTA